VDIEILGGKKQMNTKPSLRAVFAQLGDEGLTGPIAEEAVVRSLSREPKGSALPWYVKLFVGISAWIAAILITAFLFIIRIITEDQALFFGLVFCGLAIVLNWINRTNIFLGQLSLALSLTGQVLAIIGFATFFSFNELFATVAAISVLEVVLIALHRDPVVRFISTLIIFISILILIFDQDQLTALHALIFILSAGILLLHLGENYLKLRGFEEVLAPVGNAMTVSLLGILIMPLLDEFRLRWEFTAIALLLLLWLLLATILLDLGYSLRSSPILPWVAVSLLLLVPGLSMPGILAALIILLIGFWRGSTGLVGLASVFLVFYIWAYYYSLEWTLLVKSLVLMGSGVTLLALRYLIMRFGSKDGGRT
jgi:hypothetical protein